MGEPTSAPRRCWVDLSVGPVRCVVYSDQPLESYEYEQIADLAATVGRIASTLRAGEET